jgi:hypothetical protein
MMYATSVASGNDPQSKNIYDAFPKVGFMDNPNFTNGDPLGLSSWIENWHKQKPPTSRTSILPKCILASIS